MPEGSPPLVPVAATQAKVHFGEILHETSVEGKRFVVNRQRKPISVILSYRDYMALLAEVRGGPTQP